jgi:hypothetical protein
MVKIIASFFIGMLKGISIMALISIINRMVST